MNKQIGKVFNKIERRFLEMTGVSGYSDRSMSVPLAGAAIAINVVEDLIDCGILAKGPEWKDD